MEKIIQFLIKLPGLVMLYGASANGILHEAVKAVKEVITAIVNSSFPFISNESFKKTIENVRGAVNKLDDLLETLKKYLVK